VKSVNVASSAKLISNDYYDDYYGGDFVCEINPSINSGHE
jgi:hypothetical protein